MVQGLSDQRIELPISARCIGRPMDNQIDGKRRPNPTKHLRGEVEGMTAERHHDQQIDVRALMRTAVGV
jgi:hypothetical protein